MKAPTWTLHHNHHTLLKGKPHLGSSLSPTLNKIVLAFDVNTQVPFQIWKRYVCARVREGHFIGKGQASQLGPNVWFSIHSRSNYPKAVYSRSFAVAIFNLIMSGDLDAHKE